MIYILISDAAFWLFICETLSTFVLSRKALQTEVDRYFHSWTLLVHLYLSMSRPTQIDIYITPTKSHLKHVIKLYHEENLFRHESESLLLYIYISIYIICAYKYIIRKKINVSTIIQYKNKSHRLSNSFVLLFSQRLCWIHLRSCLQKFDATWEVFEMILLFIGIERFFDKTDGEAW